MKTLAFILALISTAAMADYFQMVRFYESVPGYMFTVVIETDIARRVKCVAYDGDSPLVVQVANISPPVDNVQIYTMDDTHRVNRVVCHY